eukprot:SAG11_NODE_39728_length_223_cov_33.443548_1_plen_59_part_01
MFSYSNYSHYIYSIVKKNTDFFFTEILDTKFSTGILVAAADPNGYISQQHNSKGREMAL